MGRFIKRENNGKIYLRESQTNEWLLVSNQSTVDTKVQKRTKQKTSNESLFKLVTVRKLEGLSLETVTARLRIAQANLERSAVLAQFPLPAPVKFPETEEDLVNYFSVHIDEDLYGVNEPVFTFFCDSYQTQIKAFVTANSRNREGWSVHLAYVKSVVTRQYGLKDVDWRLVTIDNADISPANDGIVVTEKTVYELNLDDTGVPQCFKENFSLESLKYLGGGIWGALAIDSDDKIPVYGFAPRDDSRYKQISNGKSRLGVTVVSYSVTPTYSFTWCRGQSVLRKRSRNASVQFDQQAFDETSVLVQKRNSNYALDLCLRPEMSANYLTQKTITETCNSQATYVGNTNYRLVSKRKDPDYGTDEARFSLHKYKQESNVLRPNPFGVLATSKEGVNMLRLDMGMAEGKIEQPYGIKYAQGERGVSYSWGYQYWWAYGKILDVYPTVKNQFTYFGDRLGAEGATIKSQLFVDGANPYGELIKTYIPNRAMTTWSTPINPESGWWAVRQGIFEFVLKYSMPPLFSHDGCYYYQVNPRRVVSNSSSGDRYYDSSVTIPQSGFAAVSGFYPPDALNSQNAYINVYNQILGSFGAGGISTYNIGYRPIAANDSESLLVFAPNPEQQAQLEEQPSLFPAGFVGDVRENIEIKD